MLKIFKSAIFLWMISLAFCSATFLLAQEAPIPAEISASKKAFISNVDTSDSSSIFDKTSGGPNRPYNTFYAGMKSWGRYQLVSSPADADLVFEISFVSPLGTVTDGGSSGDPQFRLTILDTKTHFVLWSITERPQVAYRRAAFDKNFNVAASKLIDDLKALTGEPAEHPAPAQSQIVTDPSGHTEAR